MIDWIEAGGNYAKLHAGAAITGKSLATLERDVLNPTVFVRVPRSAIA